MNSSKPLSQTSDRISRRTLLGTTAAGLAALAGCSGGSETNPSNGGDGNSNSPSANVITSVDIDGSEIVIGLDNTDAAGTFQLVNPEGEQTKRMSIPHGVSQKTTAIPEQYTPGEFTLRALQDTDNGTVTVDETTFSLEPDLEITRVATTTDLSEQELEEYEGDNQLFDGSSIYVTIENVGTGPAMVTGLTVTGHLPEDAEPEQNSFEKARIGKEYRILNNGEKVMLGTADLILGGDDIYPSTGEITVTVNHANGQNPSTTREIEYGANNYNVGAFIESEPDSN